MYDAIIYEATYGCTLTVKWPYGCRFLTPVLDCANNNLEFTKTIITGDETRVYGYNSESKFQSLQ